VKHTRQPGEVRRAESPLIAIVDDDASIRDALTSLLRAAGWQGEDCAAAGTR
jgi:FixJ family two-component response regulator